MLEQHPEPNDFTVVADRPKPAIPYGWVRALLYLVAIVAVLVVVSLVAVLVLGEGIGATQLDKPQQAVHEFIQLLLIFGVTWVFRLLLDRRSLASLGFRLNRRYVSDFVRGCLWGAAIMTLPVVILGVTGHLHVVVGSAGLVSMVSLTFTIVFAAAAEEIICRGYLLNNLMDSMPRWPALVVVSVLFSLLHLGNSNVSWIGLLNIVLAGLVLGVYYIYRRNLWFPIGLHIAWNYFQGGVYGIPVSGYRPDGLLRVSLTGPDLVTGGAFGLEGSIVTSCVLVAVVAVLCRLYRPAGSELVRPPSEEPV